MTRIIALSALLFLLHAPALASGVSVPGADAIAAGKPFDAPVQAQGVAQPGSVKLISGKLPYGLRITRDGRIAGLPTAVERTSAVIKVTGADGAAAEGEVAFAAAAPEFRLIYRDLPAVKLGETVRVQIQGQGGAAPYGGCRIEMARTFYADAAEPGAPAPAVDAAPEWLAIGGDCALTAAAPDREAVVLLVVSARDAAGATSEEFYALRSAADPSAPGWLESKAREYNKHYDEVMSPTGLAHEMYYDGSYAGYGDTAIWTGTYCGGAAFYYAVTGEDYARANVEKCLTGMTQLREITGVPGLIARSYEVDEWKGRRDKPIIDIDPAHNQYEVKEGKYKGWRFRGTASRDQFTGVFWGNAIIWQILNEPDFAARAAENITAMAAHIWDNNMHIMDVDGKHTRHGVMSGWGIQDSDGEKNYDPYVNPAVKVPNGMNSAMLLNWFGLAAAAAPDPQLRETWRARVMGMVSKCPSSEPGREFECNYVGNLKKVYVYGEAYNDYYETVWFNLNLLFNNYYHLILFEPNPKLADKYRDTIRYFWEDKKQIPEGSGCDAPTARRAGRERNPHFTWQYLAAQGAREPRRIFGAVSELMAFPHGPRKAFEPKVPMTFAAVPDHPDWACEPLPVQYRVTSDFQWQRSPYKIGSNWPTGDRYFQGIDMITPYWMGRYYGFIPGNI
jgi:hypothetical protein